MNIRCPNCGAVFPSGKQAEDGGEVECPLCLVSFTGGEGETASAPHEPLPSVSEDQSLAAEPVDEFETLGSAGGFDTVVLGGTGTNPFADSGRRDPFGGGSERSDPFAAEGFGRPSADPFGSAPATKRPAASAGAPAASSGGDVDFDALLGAIDTPDEGDAHGASTVMLDRDKPGGLFDDGDSLFGAPPAGAGTGGQDDDSLFLATANTSGAVFDDDEDLSPLPQERPGTVRGIEPMAPRGEANAPPPKPPAGPRIAKLLLVLLCGGIALDYMGMPGFGLAEILATEEEVPESADNKLVAKNLIRATRLDDTLDKYLLEASRLSQVSAAMMQDEETKRLHLDRLLDIYERFPDHMAADPHLRGEIEAYQKVLDPFPARFKPIELLARAELDHIEPILVALAADKGAKPDDVGVAVQGTIDLWQRKLLRQALNTPGLFSRPEDDPMRMDGSDEASLKTARVWLDGAAKEAARQANHVKFAYYDAKLRDLTGDFTGNSERLPKLLAEYPDQNEARLLYVSALIETNLLGQAAKHLKEATGRAQTNKRIREQVAAWQLEARLASRRGRRDDQVVALQGIVQLRPNDELTRVRMARLMLLDKRAQECQHTLVEGKKLGMASIAFEVALVEYWLWANREEDALAETVAATKKYPESVDLLFLRGQVEEQQRHHATARDYFAKVIAREPRHLRAALRLAELQGRAGRHDDALITLQNTRERLGDEASILEPMAKELFVLERVDESRKLYGLLLEKQPSNRHYLLSAARLDLSAGRVDQALIYLRMLRDDSALDREGALQLALALASKGSPKEAASTLLPFAEKEPTNMRLNSLTGKYLLDSDDIDRAVTFLKRAYAVAHRQGGDPETLFEYGRLAFRQGAVKEGSNRMQLAIKGDPRAHRYRYHLARFLLKADPEEHPTAHEVAVGQLRYLTLHAERLAETDNPIKYLDDVHRLLANHYVHEQRFEKALPHLRRTLELAPDDVDTQVNLGTALFQVNHADAESVLREVVKHRPKNAEAALYLGLISLTKNHSSEAMKWFGLAVVSADPKVVEAHYQLALIHRDRRQFQDARRHLRLFLKRASPDHAFRQDADGLLKTLGG